MKRLALLGAAALLGWAPLTPAQRNVGDVLDAKAKVLSPDEFRQELVQRTLIGSTAVGGTVELMYLGSGSLQGSLTNPSTGMIGYGNPIEGQWTTDDRGRICTSMRLSGGPRMATAVVVPPRCQFWFKLGERYFVADSDYDRGAKVLIRTLKE